MYKRQGADGADGYILSTTLHNLRHVCLDSEEGPGEENAQQGKDDIAAGRQEHAVGRRQIGPLKILLPQALGEQRIDTNTGTGCHRCV